jgi:hypothetical protein
MKRINQHTLTQTLFGLLFLLLISFKSYAEGTATASQNSNIVTAVSILPSQLRGNYLGCPQDNRIYFRINSNNERLYYGFNWRNYSSTVAPNPAISNVYMRIFDPAGNQVAQVNLPTSGNGYINTWSAASIGANVSGSHPGGYTPLSYNPSSTGEYWVEFYQSNDGGNTQAPTTAWSFSPFWDLQVATPSGVRSNGRVHCDKWSFNAMHPTDFYTSFDQD